MDLPTIQKTIADWEKDRGYINSADERMTFLAEEIGELAKWVRTARNRPLTSEEKDEMAKEFADVFQHVVSLANQYNIDLEAALKLKKKI